MSAVMTWPEVVDGLGDWLGIVGILWALGRWGRKR